MFRITMATVGFLSIFFFSPVVTLVCALALSIRYTASEVLFMGLLSDFMWMPLEGSWYSIPFGTLIAIFMVWLAEPLRSAFLRS